MMIVVFCPSSSARGWVAFSNYGYCMAHTVTSSGTVIRSARLLQLGQKSPKLRLRQAVISFGI